MAIYVDGNELEYAVVDGNIVTVAYQDGVEIFNFNTV